MFIKYGAESHLRALVEQGKMYMNPCKYFRELEADQLLKGIGDRNDGGIITNSGTLLLQHRNGDYYKAQDQSVAFIVEPCLCVPIFCLKRSEQAKISIAEREKLRKQFPNHTHALIIEDEHAFLKNIQSSFDENAFCHEIFYQDKFFTDYLEFLLSGQSDITFNVPAATARYYAEIYMVPDDHNKSTVRFRIDDSNYYKTMFRKGVFFEDQYEYRIVLPYEKINSGKVFNIQPFKATLCQIDDLVQ